MTAALLLGAVAYDTKVVAIWSGFRDWLRSDGFDLDFVLYSNYERQVEDLVAGRIDVAWNSPLAWIRAQRMAHAASGEMTAVLMRDTDCDLRSVIVVRADSDLCSLSDLHGRVIATGAVDSPQATLLPLSLVRTAGLTPGLDVTVQRYDIGVGLHGDHIGGERDAAIALTAGRVDAAAMIDNNLLAFTREGSITAGSVRVLASTGPYDHCNMTAGAKADPRLVGEFTDRLQAMSYADPEVRPLLDLEGLKQWVPGRVSGYPALDRAVNEARFYDAEGSVVAADYRP